MGSRTGTRLYPTHPPTHPPITHPPTHPSIHRRTQPFIHRRTHPPKQMRKKPSLARALWKSFGGLFIEASLLKFAYDSLLFVGPLLLNKLITYLGSEEPIYKGFEYLGLLFVSSVCSSICLHQYFHRCFRTGR